VDYEHQTLYGDKAPASGWIRHPDGLRVEGEKLYAKIEWTDEAKKTIKKEQYRYLSPVLVPHATDATSGEDIGCLLHSVALTNTPFFTELPPIAAKSSQQKKENLMTKEQIEALKTENEELKAQNEEHRKVVAKAKVKEAIAAKKLHKEQEEWAQEYALKDPEGFDAYLDAAKPQPDVPADNQYPASNKPDAEPFDMTKM
jgi:phage I-like protein